MAVTTTNLGVITAYGDAVAAGYTGTKAEWQALMASYATVGQQAVDAKNAAVAAKDTAVSQATEATTAASTATTKANEASASAQSIAQSAAQIQENTDSIDQLMSDLWNVSNDFARLDATFVRGEVNNPSATHRVMTESILSFSYPVFLKCVDDAFRFYVYLYDDNDSPTGLGWHLDYAYFSAGTKFRIVIAKRTEVAEPADINLYTSKILRQITPSFELEKVLSPYNKNIFTEHLYKHFEIKNYSAAAGKFINGGYQAIAVPMIYPFNVVITNLNSTLYQFNVKTWNGNSAISTNYKGTSGWLDSAYTVPANTYFTIEYSRKVNTAPFPMVYEMPNIVSFSGVDMIPDLDVSDLLGDVDTLNFWNQSAASYSEYLKRYMAHDMDHKYYTNGTIIDAPKYYCHVAIHKLPVGVTVDFDDASFKVQFFNKDGDEGSEDITWSTDAKYIPKNTYFMISAQYSTAITLDEWYSKFNVVADCDIVNQNNDGFSIKNYGSQWNIPARFQLLWFSDIHADQIRLKRIVDYMSANSDNISDAICTGDMVSDKVTDDFTFWSTCGANNILTIIGNHDGNTGSGWATNQTMYDKFFAPYIANWGVTYTANYCNWYKVYNNQVMLIGLCAVNSTAEEAAEMLNFLTTALNAAKTSGYAVVIAHHYPSNPSYTTAYKTPFESIGYNPVDLFIPESVFSAVETFKNGGGEFVCYITGHTHADLARYRTVENQIVLTVSTAFISAGIQQNAQFREFHTKYQDLFNILYVDTANKIVSIKRIGSDRDVWFRKIDYLTINYQTGEILP